MALNIRLKSRKELLSTLQGFYTKPVARVSLELFLTVGTVLFFAIFAIRPTLLTMSDLIKEIEDKRKLDDQMAQKIAALTTVQNTMLRLQNRLFVLDQAIPDSPNVIESLKIIEKVASENKLVINDITISEVPDELQATDLDRVSATRLNTSISFGVTGDYLTIRQFVQELLSVRRSFVIDTVSFGKTTERGQETLKATITLAVPYFAPGSNATSGAPRQAQSSTGVGL